MSARVVIIALKTITFAILSTVMVATVYGYRLDDSGTVSRTGIVDISFVPRDADLFVDGSRVETANGKIVLPLSIGQHDVVVRKIGYQSVRKQLDVDSTLANRMGTIYLTPTASALQWSGQSNRIQRATSSSGPRCETATQLNVDGVSVMKNGKTVTIGNKVASREASAVLRSGGVVLIGSEFSLLSVTPSSGGSSVIHRFDSRIKGITAGPSDDNVFVSTSNDVALCSIPNAVCTRVLHSIEPIEATTYDSAAERLSIRSARNQDLTVTFEEWATGFFGF